MMPGSVGYRQRAGPLSDRKKTLTHYSDSSWFGFRMPQRQFMSPTQAASQSG